MQLSKKFPDKQIKEIVITCYEFETKELEEIESTQNDFPISILKNFSKAKLAHIFSFLKKQLLENENVTVISVNNFQVEFQLFKFINDEIVPFKHEQKSKIKKEEIDNFLDGKKCFKFIVYYLNNDELGQIKHAMKGKKIKLIQVNKFDISNGALLMIRRNTLGENNIFEIGKFDKNIEKLEDAEKRNDSDFEEILEVDENAISNDNKKNEQNYETPNEKKQINLFKFYSNIFEISDNSVNSSIIVDFGTTFTKINFPSPNSSMNIFHSIFTLNIFESTTIFSNPKEMTPILLENSIFDLKKIIGKKFFQIEQDVIWPFHVAFPEIDKVSIQLKNHKIPPMKPEIILGLCLKKFNCYKNIILTIPTFFSEEQKFAIFEAAKIAEFHKIFLVDDLMTKLLAICVKSGIAVNGKILVIDIGGGKTDVAIFGNGLEQLSKPLPNECENYFVGGRNFDNVLFEYFLNQIVDEDEKEKIFNNNFHKFQLWQFCQKIKELYEKNFEIK